MTKAIDPVESSDEIIKSALSSLKKKNRSAFDLLIESTNEGFFDKHQSKGKIYKLADLLLETIDSKGG